MCVNQRSPKCTIVSHYVVVLKHPISKICSSQHSQHHSSPAPSPLLLRLQPNLRLLILLVLLNLPAILLVLARPPSRQILHILDEAVDAAVVHPQPDQPHAGPQHQAEDKVDPEEDRAVHHVEDLEADEERGDHDEDGGCIGLGHEAREEGLQVCLKCARDAEEGGDEREQRRGDGGREEPWQQRDVV